MPGLAVAADSISTSVDAVSPALKLFDRAVEDAAETGGFLGASEAGKKVPSVQRLPGVEVYSFKHEGHQVRGLRASADMEEGGSILHVPRRIMLGLPQELEAQRFQKLKTMRQWSKNYPALAFYFAEKKAELVDRPKEHLTPLEQYWAAHLKSVPTFEEYRDMGMPLAARESDLRRLRNLPKVGAIESWVRDRQALLQQNLRHYNANRGLRPALSMRDAIWGRIIATSRSFLCDGNVVAPVVDFMNNKGKSRNVDFYCIKGELYYRASMPIKKGDELTINYKSGSPPEALFEQYGEFEGAQIHRWSEDDCKVLRAEGFDKSDSAFLKTVGKLVEASCAGPPRKNPFDDTNSKLILPVAAVPDHLPAAEEETATAKVADAMSAATKLQAVHPLLAFMPALHSQNGGACPGLRSVSRCNMRANKGSWRRAECAMQQKRSNQAVSGRVMPSNFL